MRQYDEKKNYLYEKMKEYVQKDVCIAFSGGVDLSLIHI